MKLDPKITSQIQATLAHLKRFRLILFIALFASFYAYLLVSVSQLTVSEPEPGAIQSELSTVKRLNIDEEAVQQMKQLQEENIVIESQFDDTRTNPFSE